MRSRLVKSSVGAGALVLIATTACLAAYKNLQHYPKDISSDDLKAAMKTLKNSLGVNCSHCHQTKPNGHMDVDTDTKKIARSMLDMTDKLNKDCFTKTFLGIKEGDVKEATCYLCHKGKEKPVYKPEKPDDNAKFEAACKEDKNKAMAASMKKLVDKINKDFFTKDLIKADKAPKATCWMCHAGKTEVEAKLPDDGD